jgi:Trk K+ transport system NAD-binding subunit
MRIAIIGARRIGGNVARQLADETGATVASPAAAVAFAEVVVVSVP